jgi:hypothetical protein
MSEEANPQAAVLPPPPAEPVSVLEAAADPEVKATADTNGAVPNGAAKASEPKEVAIPTVIDAPAPAQCKFFIQSFMHYSPADSIFRFSATNQEATNDKQTNSEDVTQDKPAPPHENMDMANSTKPDDAAPAADESAEPTADTPASAGKSKARRKSGGVPEHKGKKLNKKASKAKMTHSDAKPGDYFYVRLKGYPLWPAIVCDESMLPNTLIKSRPVTAARPDGSYRADFEDGGPKVKDRSFPVMYLHTNEL